MARIRTIKPDAYASLGRQGISLPARWFFVGMTTFADDHGRFEWMPRRILGDIFPEDPDVSVTDVESWLAELVAIGTIVMYEANGRRYGHFPKWQDHQYVKNPSKSLHPTPDISEVSPDSTEDLRKVSPLEEGRGKKDIGRGNNPPTPLAVVRGGAPRDDPDEFDDPGEDENEDELVKVELPWWIEDDSPGGKLAGTLAGTRINSKTDPDPYSHGERGDYLTKPRCDDLAARIQELDPGGDALESLLGAWNEHHEDKLKPPYKDAVRALGDWVTRREPEWRKLKKARSNPASVRDQLAGAFD